MTSSSSPVALITGGSSGMGLLITKHLLSLGWNVTVVDLNDHDFTGTSLSDNVGVSSHRIKFVKADITNYAQLAAGFVETRRTWRRLDFVFANAGIGDTYDILSPVVRPEDEHDDSAAPIKPDLAVIDVCLSGVIYAVHLAIYYFRKNPDRHGKIVATSSQFGLYSADFVPMYVAAKHGVVGFTRAIAMGLKRSGDPMTMNCICPGAVDTGLGQGLKNVTPDVYMTPHSTIVRAVMSFLEDDSKNGLAAECRVQEIRYIESPPATDEATQYLLNTSFEKLLEMREHEKAEKEGTPNT